MSSRLIDYANVPKAIARVVSNRLATLHELQTVYGGEDLYDMLEIMAVDTYNRNVIESQGN